MYQQFHIDLSEISKHIEHIKVKTTLKLNIGTSHNSAGGCLHQEMKKLEKGRIYRHFETQSTSELYEDVQEINMKERTGTAQNITDLLNPRKFKIMPVALQ